MQNKITIARTVVGLIAGRAVGNTVTKAIKFSVPTNNNLEKVELAVGSFVLAGMVADKAIAWTHEQFDDGVETFRALKERMNEDATEDEDTTTEE